MVNKITTPPTQNEVIDKINELVDDKQDTITSSNKLSASLVSGLATVATSGSYNDLSNKPTIPTVNNATLTIQKNGSNVATFTANASSNVTANISVPNTVSSVSSSSTNADAVGAKLFYDTCGDIEAALHTINSGVAVNNYTLSWYGVSSFSSDFSQIDLTIVCLGHNDNAQGVDAATFKDEYTAFLEKIKEKNARERKVWIPVGMLGTVMLVILFL